MTPSEPFERGVEVGRVATTLAEHEEHLSLINGSIAKTAQALTDLTSEVRGLREDARLREDRVSVVADTLATETERRRSDLADTAAAGDRQFSRRERLMAVSLALATFIAGVLTFFNPFD